MRIGSADLQEAHPFIIAEMSGNHMKDMRRAMRIIDAAVDAGADAIKVQTFTAEEICADGIVIPRGYDANHDAWLDKLGVQTQRDLFQHGGLPRAWHIELARYANDCGLLFLSTPFSVDAAKFLVEEVGVPALKIASGDLTFTPLLRYANSTNLPVILSTGGSRSDEIAAAIQSHLLQAYMRGNLALLQCTQAYPCPMTAANVRAVQTLAGQFPSATVGLSDHTRGVAASVAAVALGARIIEKHITLADREGIDAGHSLTPEEFAFMVSLCQDVPACVGDGVKEPQDAELHDRIWTRRNPSDWLRPTQAAREGKWV